VGNFFSNLGDLGNAANNLLQGKPQAALNDLVRFAFNSTWGLLGVLDIASEAGLPKHNEDFGQTLAVWGVGDGPYLVLPLFGGHNLRDTAALPVDYYSDPTTYVEGDAAKYLQRQADDRWSSAPSCCRPIGLPKGRSSTSTHTCAMSTSSGVII